MTRTSDLRVLHIASGDLWAGAESQLFTLVTTLHHSLNVTVFVALLNHGTLEDRLRKAGIEVIILDESRLNNFQIFGKLVFTIRKLHPDVIHTHRFKENILCSIATLFSGRTPSLRTVHGSPEHPPSWQQISKRISRHTDKLVMRLIQNKIIAVSDVLAEELKNDYPCEKICVIENGIDINLISNPDNNSTPARAQDEMKCRIGLAGRLAPVKRVDLFIKTARYLLDHHPDINIDFHIFGDGPLRNELEALSRHLHTDHIVHFEGHCDDITNRLKVLDMILMTSDHEGLPMVLMEAMALNVPVIAHAVGGITKLLDQGDCGVLVSDHTAAGYAEKILYLYQSSHLRTELAAKASNRVSTDYSAIHNARTHLTLYHEIRKFR